MDNEHVPLTLSVTRGGEAVGHLAGVRVRARGTGRVAVRAVRTSRRRPSSSPGAPRRGRRARTRVTSRAPIAACVAPRACRPGGADAHRRRVARHSTRPNRPTTSTSSRHTTARPEARRRSLHPRASPQPPPINVTHLHLGCACGGSDRNEGTACRMLSLGKLAPGQQQYYLATVAAGAEEYYTGAKEAPGEWTGRSAARLGLDRRGRRARRFTKCSRVAIHGRANGLTRAQGAPKVPGFDATFCAPKSVSLLFALGEPEASNEVRNAHDAAVDRSDGRVRGRGGTGAPRTRRQGTSPGGRVRRRRVSSPHLPWRVIRISTPTCWSPTSSTASTTSAGRRWMPVGCTDGRRPSGISTRRSLRAELTRRLGVAWTPVRNGIADIDGMLPRRGAGVLDPPPRDRDAPRRTRRDQRPRRAGRRLRDPRGQRRRDPR